MGFLMTSIDWALASRTTRKRQVAAQHIGTAGPGSQKAILPDGHKQPATMVRCLLYAFLHRLWGCVFDLSTGAHLGILHSSWTKEGTHQG